MATTRRLRLSNAATRTATLAIVAVMSACATAGTDAVSVQPNPPAATTSKPATTFHFVPSDTTESPTASNTSGSTVSGDAEGQGDSVPDDTGTPPTTVPQRPAASPTATPDGAVQGGGELDSDDRPGTVEPDDGADPVDGTPVEQEDTEVSSGRQVTNNEDGSVQITGNGDAWNTVELGEGEWTARSSVTGNDGAWFVVRLLGSSESATSSCWNDGRGVLLADVSTAEGLFDSTLPITIDDRPDAWCEPGSFTVLVFAVGSWTVTLVNHRTDDAKPPPAATATGDMRFTQVSVGRNHACAVTTEQAVTCWGRGTYGKATPPLQEFRQVAAADSSTCGLTSNGTIRCWGDGYWGQTAAPDGIFVQINFSCGLGADGSVTCWRGHASAATATDFRLKQLAPRGPCGITAEGAVACSYGLPTNQTDEPVEGAYSHMGDLCGTRTDGSVFCWGAVSPDSTRPLTDDSFLSTSDLCGITTEGAIRCWGTGQYGRANRPEEAPEGTYTQLDAGDSHSCAVTTEGTVRCWGEGYEATTPPADEDFVSVAVGDPHACGITANRELRCWGYDYRGDAPSVEGWRAPGFGGLPSGEFTQVSVGLGGWDDLSCAVRADGSVACWTYSGPEEDIQLGAGRKAADVSVGTQLVCAWFADGGAECTRKPEYEGYTSGSYSTLCVMFANGGGECSPSDGIAEGFDSSETFSDWSTGWNRGCGVRSGGTISCWGDEDDWPADPAGSDFVQVSAGLQQSCALRSDGGLVCWHPLTRALAEAETQIPESPPDGAYAQVSMGANYGCALGTDGEIRCWGAGLLGRAEPPPGPFASVAVGFEYACGVRPSGRIECWA